jgi:hypothetical protein
VSVGVWAVCALGVLRSALCVARRVVKEMRLRVKSKRTVKYAGR